MSHADLSNNDLMHGGFSRTSSLADLAYIAMPGLTSRVSCNRSVVSLSHLRRSKSGSGHMAQAIAAPR